MTTNLLMIGDQVRIVQDYFVECLRGAIGLISLPPEDVKAHEPAWRDYWKEDRDLHGAKTRTYWVVFDEMIYEPDNPDHPIDAGAVSEKDLELISR